jgi:hypothetical protein
MMIKLVLFKRKGSHNLEETHKIDMLFFYRGKIEHFFKRHPLSFYSPLYSLLKIKS